MMIHYSNTIRYIMISHMIRNIPEWPLAFIGTVSLEFVNDAADESCGILGIYPCDHMQQTCAIGSQSWIWKPFDSVFGEKKRSLG